MKYVKMAGHTAYTGILMVLDGYFRGARKTRKDFYGRKAGKIMKHYAILKSFKRQTLYNML